MAEIVEREELQRLLSGGAQWVDVLPEKEWWPVAAIPGKLMSELSTPEEFEAAAKLVGEQAVAESIVCGPDPEKHLEQIASFRDAGFDHVYVHQVGPDQEGFFRFYERETLTKLL